jgi:hypothetical protein
MYGVILYAEERGVPLPLDLRVGACPGEGGGVFESWWFSFALGGLAWQLKKN